LTALGWVEALAFTIICLTITFAVENLGVLTGVPFGHYAFLVEPNLPHVGVVPVIVGLLYVGMGYPSWVIANVLFAGGVSRPPDLPQLFGVPVIAAFVMVQWDVVMDPAGSTLGHAWAWYDSGGYFGVPLSNFLGWFLVTFLYFQAFSLFLYSRRTLPPIPARSRAFWAAPVLLYLAAGLCHLPPLLDPDSRLVDAGGRVWSAADLRETTVIVMLFTMLPTSLLALLRIARSREPVTGIESV
jgi:putative membrane protein